MTVKTPNKQELRTQETRKRLMAAAEEIFIRDGYEGAQLSEIAKRAKRTKGSVYGNYKSKEDLFLALYEQSSQEYLDKLGSCFDQAKTPRQRLQALRKFYIGLREDSKYALLAMEYRLFSLRHARSKQRVKKLSELTLEFQEQYPLETIFGPISADRKRKFEENLYLLGPILSMMQLESAFAPEILTPSVVERLLGQLFDTLTS